MSGRAAGGCSEGAGGAGVAILSGDFSPLALRVPGEGEKWQWFVVCDPAFQSTARGASPRILKSVSPFLAGTVFRSRRALCLFTGESAFRYFLIYSSKTQAY